MTKLWRDRLALQLRRFRRIRGRWPVASVIRSAKRGIADAERQGLKPITEH